MLHKVITEQTLIPIGIAVVVIGSIAGWATNVATQLHVHQESIERVKAADESNFKLIYEINSRLSRIEWKLENGYGDDRKNR